ncbi:hypothetical protein Tco_0672213 [Tanacetum coccineum]
MASTQASSSNPSKKIKLTIIPPTKLFMDLTHDDDNDTTTPSPIIKSSSPSPTNAPSKTPLTKDTSSTFDSPPRPSNPLPLQSHPSLDITLSLPPITPLDHIFDTPSPPPPPQPPIMGHLIYFNMFDYHGVNCLCCFHNRNLILFLRDEMNFMFAHIEYLLTSTIASPSPPYP